MPKRVKRSKAAPAAELGVEAEISEDEDEAADLAGAFLDGPGGVGAQGRRVRSRVPEDSDGADLPDEPPPGYLE